MNENNLGQIGRPAGAVASFREAIRLKPGSDRAHGALARELIDLGLRDEALAENAEVWRLGPDDSDTHFRVALALSAMKDHAGSIAEHREAIRSR